MASPPNTEGAAALLSVKIAPPRARRWVISRDRLVQRFQSVRECALFCVQAPEGYGKTSLLARLRREWLSAGACAAWLTADANDDPVRFVEALLLSTYTALGRPSAARVAEQASGGRVEPREAVGTLLGDLAHAARPTVLVIDDVHELPDAVGADLLPYLTFNLPANVHLILGTRRRLPFSTADLVAHGQYAAFGTPDLAFNLEETRALVHARCGNRIDADVIVRLHEQVEGWPMGLQLILFDLEKVPDPAAELRRATSGHAGLRTLFTETILPRLDEADAAFLTDVAALEQLQPELCAEVSGRADAREVLERLRNDTPALHAIEGSDWLRLHAVWRDGLLRRFESLPKAHRLKIHWRAARWLENAGLLEQAAHHALAAERQDTAYRWIGQALYGLATSGRVVAARAWLERLPEAIILGNDRLRLVAGWMTALSSEPRKAFALTEPLIGPEVEPSLRYEALQVQGAAANYLDDLDAAAAVSARLGDDDSSTTRVGRAANAVRRAILALSRGDTVSARMEFSRRDLVSREGEEDYAHYYAEFFIGLSYLLDARPVSAARGLARALERADAIFGRRSPPACLVASGMAAALWEQDRADAAESTLADRLDVIERTCVPEAVVVAYLTLARVALDRGDGGRTQDLLEELYALGVKRRQPRMIVASLAEQVRVQALSRRADACELAFSRLREQRHAWRSEERGVTPLVDTLCGLAAIRAALAARDEENANRQISELMQPTSAVMTARDRLELLALRCALSALRGQPAAELWHELENTAATNGLARLLRDGGPPTEPERATPGASTALKAPPTAAAIPATATKLAVDWKSSVATSGLLTAKEHEILALLAHNYSNKEIARALDVGPATVKWHLRNLFGKLNVGGRRHAVQRARMLQLVTAD